YERKFLLWHEFPILDLPDEILALIFHFVVRSATGADEIDNRRLYLTWVCGRFRAVSLSDATLWSSVWFRQSVPWERSFIYIQRAGTAALDIRIQERIRSKDSTHENPPKNPPITVMQIKNLLEVLKPRVRQLRTLKVFLVNIEVVEAFMDGFSNLAGPLAALENITIHRSGQPFLWPKEKCAGAGGHLAFSTHPIPKLRILWLYGVTTNWNAVPFSNLSMIILRRIAFEGCPTSDRWMEMLRASPRLLKLELDGAGPQFDPKSQRLGHTRPVDLPALRDLTIGNMSCHEVMHVLGQINAEHVRILVLVSLTTHDYGHLIGMLGGRFREVRLLKLHGLEIAKTDLNTERTVRWFESMPRLKVFAFWRTSPHVLNALLADPRDYRASGEQDKRPAAGGGDKRPVLCPELETVRFYAQAQKDVHILAKGRKDLGVMLKRAYTSAESGITQEEATRLRESVGQLLEASQRMIVTPDEESVYRERVGKSCVATEKAA
ncbi:uncharacterized protein TRAVEDRAFT_135719, partial [Trametes versicolor FP-101664 SS1]|uniref:uncharacterized protein n=1 Tax=Trametes versicolor (strain FP-101664) TaxID=717944 RepID=UPI0004622EF7